jgi:hypothetical protein
MYFPRAWGWLITPLALLLTDLAFVGIDAKFNGTGQLFTVGTVIAFGFFAAIYAGASAFGLWIARRKSLGKILAGSVVCSVVFYVAANTYAWFFGSVVAKNAPDSYAPTLAGWWQANTTGLPGFEPTWMFLRNGVAGDLFFALVLLLVLDRELLLGHAADKATPRMA